MDVNSISKSGVLKFQFKDNICLIDINDAKRSVNSFTIDMLEDLDENMPKILSKKDLAGIVIYSSKPDCFAAGADISIFDGLKTEEDGQKASTQLHRILDYFVSSKVTSVVAIHGVCLGGGLELALACDYRICSNHMKTQLGLPEVQLGILPGGGGTQRLPRLIGMVPALDMMLTGKKIDGKKALKLGLVDQCVPENQVLDQAILFCKKSKRKIHSSLGLLSSIKNKFDGQKFILESNFFGRFIIGYKTKSMIQKNTKNHYPAPFKILDAVLQGIGKPLDEALQLEAKLFGELVVTKESRALVHIFNMITSAKKNPCPKDIQKKTEKELIESLYEGSSSVGVLGAGLMGSGIATVLADKNIRTVLVDKDHTGVEKGLESIVNYFEDKFRKKRIKAFEKDIKNYHASPSIQFESIQNSSVIIEAVFEDLKIKHDVIEKCENYCANKNFIFATNTSSIPISDIAKVAKNPENVIGMHFFSPVPKMPLVEIITTEKTSPRALSAIFDLAVHMGKQVIVVNDGPGFYTTRILAFQIAEAINILAEGAYIEDIDGALENFGMPVGPITLLDEVGIDVGEHILQILFQAFSSRFLIPKEIHSLANDNRKGRKNGRGFYKYHEGKKLGPDNSVYKHFEKNRMSIDRKVIEERCVYVFLNEAARCLEEGILRSSDDGDLGAIFGLGFPPFLGGPFHYAKTIGKPEVYKKLTELSAKYGERFKPVSYWAH